MNNTKSEKSEIFKINVANRFLSTKSPFEIMFLRCEFTKVILYSKSWCEIFVLKLSCIQKENVYYTYIQQKGIVLELIICVYLTKTNMSLRKKFSKYF